MKAVRRRAAGAQILMTEHVEQLWLTGYKCAWPLAPGRPTSVSYRSDTAKWRTWSPIQHMPHPASLHLAGLNESMLLVPEV